MPLANEEATAEDLIDAVLAQLTARDRLYCVLDNASTDNTRQIVSSHGDPRVIVVWEPGNACISDAYFAGYRAALDSDAGWILEMDGGFSHRPEQIPRFLNAMATGVDFAAGSRFMSGSRIDVPYNRYILSKGGTLLANLLLGTKMTDMTSGFECFSRDALRYIVSTGVLSRAHFFQTEIRYHMHGWQWVEVPISYANDKPRVGSSPVVESLRNLWRLRKSGVYRRRGTPI